MKCSQRINTQDLFSVEDNLYAMKVVLSYKSEKLDADDVAVAEVMVRHSK